MISITTRALSSIAKPVTNFACHEHDHACNVITYVLQNCPDTFTLPVTSASLSLSGSAATACKDGQRLIGSATLQHDHACYVACTVMSRCHVMHCKFVSSSLLHRFLDTMRPPHSRVLSRVALKATFRSGEWEAWAETLPNITAREWPWLRDHL